MRELRVRGTKLVLAMMLHPSVSAAGVRLAAHAVLDSTNTHALLLAREGERGPLWITALSQTTGRGRRGRAWVSQPGNLFASLLLAAPSIPEQWPQLSFVAALAVYDAVSESAAKLTPLIAIKWPNDILLRGAKLAGILVEAEGGADAVVAIGIGVNCVSHPDVTDYPAIDLAAAGAPVTPASLFSALSLAMFRRLAQWDRGRGFASVRADWIARAAFVGQRISMRLADRTIGGYFNAVDEKGNLMLRLDDDRMETISAGDVFMLTRSAANNS
jgi:BirA family transcriptional regulator, biotin operon repressor / biotin---[acetyl-CoA-carboxylase] ligase